MKIAIQKIELTLERCRVIVERADTFRDAVYLTVPLKNDGWLAELGTDEQALGEARNLVFLCTGKPSGQTASSADLRALVDLLRKVTN